MPQTRGFSSSSTNASSANWNYLDRGGKGFSALTTAILGLMVTVLFHTTQVEEHQLLGRKIDDKAVDHTVLKIHRPLALTNQEVKPKCHPRPPRPGTNLFALQAQHMDFTQGWKSSAAYQGLREVFEKVLFSPNAINITSCMCLCLGDLSQPS